MLRKHVDAQPKKRFKIWKVYDVYTIFEFGMLQVCENEISVRKWSAGTTHLRALEGTMTA